MNTLYTIAIIRNNYKTLLCILGVYVGIPVLAYFWPITAIILALVVIGYQMVKIRLKNEYIREMEEDIEEDEYERVNGIEL